MIVSTIISFLSTALSPVPVSGAVPANPPDTFITVEQTGGSQTNRLDRATVTIQSYAPSIEAAAQLNDSVASAMASIVSLDSVSRCSRNADYNFTDSARGRCRYQAVFDLVYYR